MSKKDPKWLGLNKKVRWGRTQVPGFKDEEAWCGMLEQVGGSRSLGDMGWEKLARIIDHLAQEYGVQFSQTNNKPYRTGVAGRRSDYYEIPDGPEAGRKRALCAIWRKLGYDMMSLDERVKRQFGVEAFRWLNDPVHLGILARDLNKRLADKMKKAAATEKAAV